MPAVSAPMSSTQVGDIVDAVLFTHLHPDHVGWVDA
jgi:glyoxylase-like metal-dependent hydrolase (beta-lactamase superfamily II)